MTPAEIVENMIENDAFSKWLGIEISEITDEICILTMTVTENHLNGFKVAHGGISYSLSDSAMAFLANASGKKCMSIESSISHLRKVELKDLLTATCKKIHLGSKLGVFEVEIHNQDQKSISHFKGTVFVSQDVW